MTPRVGDRGLFPDLASVAYLNHASCSPVSFPVRAAVDAMLERLSHAGAQAVSGSCWPQVRESVRREAAELTGARPADIGLVANTTAAIQSVAFGIAWKPGDTLVIYDGDFPGNVTPWHSAAELFRLSVVRLPMEDLQRPGGADLAALEQALRGGVRLLVVSAVHFASGLRLPLRTIAKLCRQYGAELFVDAVQCCGATPLGVSIDEIDYLACGGHKFLMAPMGSGFVYVHPGRVKHLVPRLAGWRSHERAAEFLYPGGAALSEERALLREARVVEAGSYSLLSLAGLDAALRVLNLLGRTAISEHIGSYIDELEAGLRARGFVSARTADIERHSAILSMEVPAETTLEAVDTALGRHGIAVGTPCGRLRFAPHWPNALDEVPLVLDAVDSSLGRSQGRR